MNYKVHKNSDKKLKSITQSLFSSDNKSCSLIAFMSDVVDFVNDTQITMCFTDAILTVVHASLTRHFA